MQPRSKSLADWPLVAMALTLSAAGVAMVFSAGETDVPTFVHGIWRTQLTWLVLGVAIAYGITRLSVRAVEWAALPVYLASALVLLVLVFIGQGAGTAAGTKSWLAIGGVRLGQPS
jgi:rod shape determining protein RodA